MVYMPTEQIFEKTANDAWLSRVDSILEDSTVREARSIKCYDQMNASTGFNMDYPIVTCRDRGLGYRFLAGEAWWILSGRNDVQSISPYSSQIPNFSDDNIMFNGAYGPQIRDQLNYVTETLAKDMHTRQAVLTIWRPNPRPSKDIPCTISVQWLITEKYGNLYLNCIDNMRSSDIWLGWVYDVFNFTMLTHYIRASLKFAYGMEVEMGNLWLNAGSQHLYSRNYDDAIKVSKNRRASIEKELNFTEWLDDQLEGDDHPEDIIDFLKFMADDGTLMRIVRDKSWPPKQAED